MLSKFYYRYSYNYTICSYLLFFCKVLWIRHYNKKAAAEAPTLRGLRNILNRTSVPNDPKKNIKATEDFLDLVVKCHVIAAASTVIADKGSSDLKEISTSVLVKFNFKENQPISSILDDGVMLYACDLLTTGLFWLLFVDAIREGDGDRVMICWKFLLLIFFSSKRKNYTKEAVILLLQLQTMSPRQAAQLQWARFINTQGRQGTNKPADLHLEHLNRRLKIVMRNIKGNIKVSILLLKLVKPLVLFNTFAKYLKKSWDFLKHQVSIILHLFLKTFKVSLLY